MRPGDQVGEEVAGYRIAGSKGLHGDTFDREINGLFRQAGRTTDTRYIKQLLAQVNAEAGEIRGKWLPATQAIARMSLSLEQYRVAEGRALVAASAEASLAVETDLKARAQELQRQRTAYESTIVDPTERATARKFDGQWAAYKAVSDETLAAVRAGEKEQAALIYNGKAREPMAAARAGAAMLMDLNVQGGHAAALRGEAVFVAARAWIIGALGLAALLCGLTAVVVVRSVTTPVLTMARTMQRLAAGDSGTAIAGVGRHDEIGRMADALEVFRRHEVERDHLAAMQAEQERHSAEEKRAALVNMAETIESETTSALDQDRTAHRGDGQDRRGDERLRLAHRCLGA